jgi:hypothetical protein
MATRLDPPFKTPVIEGGFFTKAWELFIRALINRQEIIVKEFATNGALTEFTLACEPKDKNHTLAFVNGSYQKKAAYSVSGNKITFSSAPASGWLEVITYGR